MMRHCQCHELFWSKQFSFSVSQTGMSDKYLHYPLTVLRQFLLKFHFVIKRNCKFLDAILFELLTTKRMVFKYHIEINGKNNQEQVKIF